MVLPIRGAAIHSSVSAIIEMSHTAAVMRRCLPVWRRWEDNQLIDCSSPGDQRGNAGNKA